MTTTLFTDFLYANSLHGELNGSLPIQARMYTRTPDWEFVRKEARSYRGVHTLTARSGWVPIAQRVVPVVNFQPVPSLWGEAAGWGQGFNFFFYERDDVPAPALLHAGSGWQVRPGQGVAQDIVIAVVVHAIGTYDGVLNPILMLTQDGLPEHGALHQGSIYGTGFAPKVLESNPAPVSFGYASAAYMVPVGNNLNVSSWSLSGDTMTIRTETSHHFAVDDFVDFSSLGEPREGFFRIHTVTSPTAFQVRWEGPVPDPGVIWPKVRAYTSEVVDTGLATRLAVAPLQEPSSAHVWMAPQRINYVANPSFEGEVNEDGSTFGWTHGVVNGGSATFEVVAGGVQTESYRTHCAHVERDTPPAEEGEGRLVLQSNRFPALDPFLSISMKISGIGPSGDPGSARVGILAYSSTGQFCTFVRSDDTAVETGSADGPWTTVEVLVKVPEDALELALRVEYDGDEMWLDDVLVDSTVSKYDYFDGDSNDGLPQDFRWHGGKQNKQFSMWYNNWRNTDTRLFGSKNEDGSWRDGHLEDWLPEASRAIPHYDAFDVYLPDNWTGDYFYPIIDVAGTDICDVTGELDLTLAPFGTYITTEYDANINTESLLGLLIEESTAPVSLLLDEDSEPLYFEEFGLTGPPISLP